MCFLSPVAAQACPAMANSCKHDYLILKKSKKKKKKGPRPVIGRRTWSHVLCLCFSQVSGAATSRGHRLVLPISYKDLVGSRVACDFLAPE
ncbi:hypothetical protein BDZ91DRAFT_751896 [Kalaharituber pfeilii]|nr:hypothetical protein BDZ91DRAFT_751896 [Kalaharituber pfeilii]